MGDQGNGFSFECVCVMFAKCTNDSLFTPDFLILCTFSHISHKVSYELVLAIFGALFNPDCVSISFVLISECLPLYDHLNIVLKPFQTDFVLPRHKKPKITKQRTNPAYIQLKN